MRRFLRRPASGRTVAATAQRLRSTSRMSRRVPRAGRGRLR